MTDMRELAAEASLRTMYWACRNSGAMILPFEFVEPDETPDDHS